MFLGEQRIPLLLLLLLFIIIIIIGGILVVYIYIYITILASKEIFSPSDKIHCEVGQAKDLSAPLYTQWIPRRGHHWSISDQVFDSTTHNYNTDSSVGLDREPVFLKGHLRVKLVSSLSVRSFTKHIPAKILCLFLLSFLPT
jgi:hypothetical protein